MKTLFAVGILLALSPVHASLPPFYDSAEQIKAVISSDKVVESIGEHANITKVEMLTKLHYRVFGSNDCNVVATLRVAHPNNTGPTAYTVKNVSLTKCIEQSH